VPLGTSRASAIAETASSLGRRRLGGAFLAHFVRRWRRAWRERIARLPPLLGAFAARRRPRASTAPGGGAARLLDPDELLLADVRDRVRDLDQVAVDLGDRVVLGVHVRLDDVDVHLLALGTGTLCSSISAPRALPDVAKWSSGSPSEPVK
jgi:hypothetical protein